MYTSVVINFVNNIVTIISPLNDNYSNINKLTIMDSQQQQKKKKFNNLIYP